MTTEKLEKQHCFEGIETDGTIEDTGDTENNATTESYQFSDVGLLVGSRWKVVADGLDVIVLRKRVTKNENIRWDPQGYFATPAGAFNFLVEQNIRDTGLKDLKTVVDVMAELKRDVIRALKVVSK